MTTFIQSGVTVFEALYTSFSNVVLISVMDYPNVETEEHFYIVEENISALKHQQNIEAFGPKACGKVLNWEYTIYAKNLPKPINGKFTLEVVKKELG